MNEKIKCEVCFRHCLLEDGQVGACFARKNKAGQIVADNYGKVTSLALDLIEKKPLYHFYPGSLIVSVGSYGCNLKCPFCQNVEISLADGRLCSASEQYSECSPEELAAICRKYQPEGNIGIAFTYNEPLIGYEFVRDTAKLVQAQGMKTVLVTNGSATLSVLEEVIPYIDGMNIDLKSFQGQYYSEVLKGDFETTKAFIQMAAEHCHVEVTTLIIPGENDSDAEMEELAAWVAETGQRAGKDIPLHISRFFPRSQYADRQPTEIAKVYHLAEVAREHLKHVYTGNC